jgi:hypothetical protein
MICHNLLSSGAQRQSPEHLNYSSSRRLLARLFCRGEPDRINTKLVGDTMDGSAAHESTLMYCNMEPWLSGIPLHKGA